MQGPVQGAVVFLEREVALQVVAQRGHDQRQVPGLADLGPLLLEPVQLVQDLRHEVIDRGVLTLDPIPHRLVQLDPTHGDGSIIDGACTGCCAPKDVRRRGNGAQVESPPRTGRRAVVAGH